MYGGGLSSGVGGAVGVGGLRFVLAGPGKNSFIPSIPFGKGIDGSADTTGPNLSR